ncbi:MAG: DUF1566 domain-containing protein [Gammaproteobacteria bacterium]|nr:DUF1566 domain-containing protein [Gammaproteobacteria bacterium]
MKILHSLLRRCAARLVAVALLAAPFLMSTEGHAAIVARAPGLAYDSTLNVTWATDAQLFDTLAASMGGNLALARAIYRNHSRVVNLPNQYSPPLTVLGLPGMHPVYTLVGQVQLVNGTVVPFPDFTVTPSPGRRVEFNWFAAQAFVNYLNGIDYLGHDDWRLPKMLDGGCVIGVNAGANSCAGGPWNEVQSLYASLGLREGISLSSSAGHNEAYGLFSGRFGDNVYWLQDEIERMQPHFDESGAFLGLTVDTGNFASALLALEAMGAGTIDGDTFAGDKRSKYARLMILRDGDSAPVTEAIGGNPVPLPAPVALFASGIVVLLAARRRRTVDGSADT